MADDQTAELRETVHDRLETAGANIDDAIGFDHNTGAQLQCVRVAIDAMVEAMHKLAVLASRAK